MTGKRFEVLEKEPLYEGRFRADRWHLRFTTHDGAWSRVHGHEVFDRGHAVAVLPWDPRDDRVVLVEQFRAGAIPTTEVPWLLEAIAGGVEAGEAPEEVARREAMEEAGLTLGRLRYVTRMLPICGSVTEELRMYVGEADCRGAGGVHGHDDNEDLKVHVLDFAEVLAMAEDGRIVAGNTLALVFWLALHREELRAAWS